MPRLTIYSNFAKRENSTKRPGTGGIGLDVALKEGTSLSNPTFVLNRWPDTLLPSAVNYALFAGRYYYIDDVTWTTAHMYEITCHVDVLATYRDMIASYNTFVERSASDFNVMIPDNLISQSTKVVEEGDIIYNGEASTDDLPHFDSIGCFILRTVSGDGINGYVMGWQGVKNMMDFLFTDNIYDQSMMADSIVKSFFNPFQYILDLKWFPLDYNSFSGSPVNVRWGWFGSENIRGIPLGSGSMGASGEVQIGKPVTYYADFRAYTQGFVEYKTYLPGVGFVDLSPEIFDGEHLRLNCDIDYKTGSVDWYFQEISGYGTSIQEYVKVATFRGQIGVPVQVGQLNADLLGAVVQGVGSAVSIAAGNIVGGVGAAIDAVHKPFSPQPSLNGTNGSIIMLSQMPYPTLSYKVYESAAIPQSVAGRPLYQYRTLGNLSGFVKCGNASIDIDGFSGEREQVNSYLNGGFYME